jgi:hypothetical protein
MAKKSRDVNLDLTNLKRNQPTVRPKDKNANYDYSIQNEPKSRMGKDSFANLPQEPMIAGYSQKIYYRDGIPNSFSHSIEETSGIHSNWAKP